MPVRAAVVGTGVMGRRMLSEMRGHKDLELICAWDENPAARAATLTAYPELDFEEDIFAQPADLFYIATPPATHMPLARKATGAVFCEKPLAVDLAEARELVGEIEIPNAVNFPFATQSAITTLEKELEEGRHGEAQRLSIQLFFNAWPRKWQEAASWLAQPEQGGFIREVFSHFAYLTDRLVGPLELIEASIHRGPEGTESTVRAELIAGDEIPVLLTGDVGGRAPDYNEWTLYGSQNSYRLQDWNKLTIGSDDGWRDLPSDRPSTEGLERQLDAVVQMVRGHPNPLPTFADALRVQELVEAILVFPLRGQRLSTN